MNVTNHLTRAMQTIDETGVPPAGTGTTPVGTPAAEGGGTATPVQTSAPQTVGGAETVNGTPPLQVEKTGLSEERPVAEGGEVPEIQPPDEKAANNVGGLIEKLVEYLKLDDENKRMQMQAQRLKDLAAEIKAVAAVRIANILKAKQVLAILEKNGITKCYASRFDTLRAARELKAAGLAGGSTREIMDALEDVSDAIHDHNRQFACPMRAASQSVVNRESVEKISNAMDKLCGFIPNAAVAGIVKDCITGAAILTDVHSGGNGIHSRLGPRERREYFKDSVNAMMNQYMLQAMQKLNESAAAVRLIQKMIVRLNEQMEKNQEAMDEILDTIQESLGDFAGLLTQETEQRDDVAESMMQTQMTA